MLTSGAGSFGALNASYQRYAREVGFHIDPCAPRAPQSKGKVERDIRTGRFHVDPRRTHWDALEELQEWSDRRRLKLARTIRTHFEGGLVHVVERLTNIVVKGTNARLCMVARRAFGFHVPPALISMRHLPYGGTGPQPRPP